MIKPHMFARGIAVNAARIAPAIRENKFFGSVKCIIVPHLFLSIYGEGLFKRFEKDLNICTYIDLLMTTKCITITSDAYKKLAVMKEGSDSFSDVINRLTKKNSLFDLVGLMSVNDAEELRRTVKLTREKIDRELSKKAERLQ